MSRAVRGGRRRACTSAASAVAVAALGVTALGSPAGHTSSHREAPLIAAAAPWDGTDVYGFVSPDKPDTVTLIANYVPLQEPNGGPNFYPFAEKTAYDINIDNDGDARPDITYRWKFRNSYQSDRTFLYNTGVVTSLDDPDLNLRQTYDLEMIAEGGRRTLVEDAPVAPSNVGPASMPNYGALSNAAITRVRGGGTSFAGQAKETFYLDLRVFDLLYGGDFSEINQNTLTGYNVNTIALQVPKWQLALRGNPSRNPVIGIWSTSSRKRIQVFDDDGSQRDFGDNVQVSRLGMPLVNEVVIPVRDKDRFNASKPRNDGQFLQYVTDPEVPRLIEAIYGIPRPATPRLDLVQAFLTGFCKACGPVQVDLNSQLLNKDVNKRTFRPSEQLRLNMSIPPSANPNRLGVLGGDLAGFPNGRRLIDDTIDATLQVAEGVLLPGAPAAVKGLGDGVNANDVPPRTAFPYVPLPSNKAVFTN